MDRRGSGATRPQTVCLGELNPPERDPETFSCAVVAVAPPPPMRVPAAVRREVWKRDQGRCQYPLDGGGVCGSRLRLEIDHLDPRCRGGKPIVSDLRLVCRFHNDLAARQALGDAVMDRYTGHQRARR
jgi:5-methylcytosine-specific restriction endonuclease McrA